ncbi:MAG: MBL fold metallo-hydrolase [Sphingobacteriales bacterium JAD_PAG50586_3]|nr:MAG: MBL fold metallo-hydrolase [Sphingobacteriales bacterium JAD_PAG50586_3]
MYVEQLYTNCLAEAAYYIESNGEAAIIDPLRETQPYIEMAAKRGAVIKYVFETHFHADFVSGHIDLARKTGAAIIYGPNANAGYAITNATDNQEFTLGAVKIKVLHTPGHTPESSCFLLLDENGKESAIFTGDTLFVGDVGRPDLAVKGNVTQEDLAGMLYHSIERLKQLPDDLVIYPAHGAGSSCGKNIGKETSSTIGQQKATNYAMLQPTKEAFIAAVTEGISAPPAYFFHDAKVNMQGYEEVDAVVARGNTALTPDAVELLIGEGATVLDTRGVLAFEKGFIPGAVNIGLDGQYAIWVGTILKPETPLLLVTDAGKEEEAVLRLARVGYENVKGYLQGGIDAWVAAAKKVDIINSVTAEEFASHYSESKVLDVRRPGEQETTGVIPEATLICLEKLEQNLGELDKNQHYYVHCAGGYRSVIAASLLKRHGYNNLTNVYGGMGAIKTTGVPLVQPEVVA